MQQVILTRSPLDNADIAKILTDRGFDPVHAPLFEIYPMQASVPDTPFDGVIATSRHALQALSPQDGVKLHTIPLYAVGPATAAAARVHGFKTVIEGAGTAAELAERIRQDGAAGSRLLFLAGEPRRPELENALKDQADLTLCCLYRSVARDTFPAEALQKIRDPAPFWLHFSLKSAERAAFLIEKTGYGQIFRAARHIALAPAIAARLAELGACFCTTARAPTRDALLECLDQPKS